MTFCLTTASHHLHQCWPLISGVIWHSPGINFKVSVQTSIQFHEFENSRVSCQKGPTRHAYAWQIGPFWQDSLGLCLWIPPTPPRRQWVQTGAQKPSIFCQFPCTCLDPRVTHQASFTNKPMAEIRNPVVTVAAYTFFTMKNSLYSCHDIMHR